MDLQLTGKVAIVTGAGTGIGAASALALAREGVAVVLFGPYIADLEQVHQQIRSTGGKGLPVVGDVSISKDVKQLIQTTVETFGGLDILFNNAAIMLNKTVVAMTEEEWDHVLAVNLTGVFLCCKYAIPLMQQRGGGSIINSGSPHALATQPAIAAYTAAKGGVLALTRQMAMDFAKDRIRVNCVIPGTIDTPMLWNSQQLSANLEEDREAWARKHPLGRLGTPEDVARAIIWLASNQSSFTTGSPLYIDGGLLAQL